MARERWRLVYPGTAEVDEFPSEVKANEFLDVLRSSWAAGGLASGLVTVQVDCGRGWETHGVVDFATETSDA